MEENNNKIPSSENKLYLELSQLIEQNKNQVVTYVNSTITLLFWQVGKRINEHILQNKRAEYGKQIVSTISEQLVKEHGRSFTERNLRRMMQFADDFADIEIVTSLMTKLSWTHFLQLLPLKTMEQKLFYAGKIADEKWSVRQTLKYIEQKTFERQIELLELHKDGIMVAEYWTELPPKKVLEKPHKALIEAKENIEKRKLL